MHHLKARLEPHLGIGGVQGHVALRAGGDHRLDAQVVQPLDVQPGEPQEVLAVAGPEQVVAAAALVGQQPRGHVEEIQEPQAVQEDAVGLHVAVLAEEDVVIGRAAAEKEGGRFRIDADLLGQTGPPFRGDGLRGHGALQRVEEAAVHLLAGQFGLAVEVAQFLDEGREIDRGRAAFIADAAGQAAPGVLLHARGVDAAGDHGRGDGPRRERLADERERTGGRALAAVLAGVHVIGADQPAQFQAAGVRVRHRFGRHGLDPGRRQGADLAGEVLEKGEQRLGFLGQEGGEAQPSAAQPHDIEHLAHVLGVALAGGRTAAVAAGAGLAADQQHAVRTLGKGLEQHGPVDAAGAGGAHHADLVRDGPPLVLEGEEGGVRPPVAEEEQNLAVAAAVAVIHGRFPG